MDLTGKRRPLRLYTSLSWTTWIVDGTLLLAAIMGACFAWPIQSEAGRLHAKRLELQRRVGEMPISDPTKYHVLLLKSKHPTEFRWRIYVPAKTDARLLTETRSSTGSSSGTSNFSGSADPAMEGLVTAIFLPSQWRSNIGIRVHTRSLHSSGSIGMNLIDETIAEMVSAQATSSWRIAGASGVESFSIEESVCLLEIEPPKKDMVAMQSAWLRIRLGTQAAIDQAKSQ